MTRFLIALPFLILSATKGCSAEAETGNTTMNENQNCSIPQLREAVQEFNRNGNWTPVKTRLEAVVNHNTSAHRLLQFTRPFLLHFIAYSGNTQLVSLLLCNGLDVKTVDFLGRTMLHMATHGHKLQMVKLLLDYGEDVNTRDDIGYTPLHVAAQKGYLDVVKYLLQAGANTTATNNIGLTALDLANFKPQVFRYLKQFPY